MKKKVVLVALSMIASVLVLGFAAFPPDQDLFMFTQDETPLTPDDPNSVYNDNIRLQAIDANSAGSLVAVGRVHDPQVGGANWGGYVIEKGLGDTAWTEIPIPPVTDNPKLYQALEGVAFIPGDPHNDFVAVGLVLPDPDHATVSKGVIARYHHDTQEWDFLIVDPPKRNTISLRDIAADPLDPDGFVIVGFQVPDDGAGALDYEPLLVRYSLKQSKTYKILSVPKLSPNLEQTNSIAALPNGTFIASGTNYSENFVDATPIVLEIAPCNTVTVLPGPPPDLLPNPNVSLFGSASLADGKIMFVGTHGPTQGGPYTSLAYRFDWPSDQWELLAPLNPGPILPAGDFMNQLIDIAQAADGTFYAAGRITIYETKVKEYRYQGMIQRFNPVTNAWTVMGVPKKFSVHPSHTVEGPFGSELWGVAVDPVSGQVFAAGYYRTYVAHPNFDFNSSLVLEQ